MATGRIILLNGPRSVGKTTAAEAIKGLRPDIVILSTMEPLKRQVIAEHGLDPAAYFDVFEMLKDSPFPELAGKTPRQAYIERGGQERQRDPFVIANAWAKQAEMYLLIGFHVLMPNCRLVEEFYATLSVIKPKDVLLMRLINPHKLDPWSGDVGSWFEPVQFGQREMWLVNGDDLDYFKCATAYYGRRFLSVGR